MATARLKQEVLAVDGIIKEFARNYPDDVPSTPSSQFPELTAMHVDVQECISSSKAPLTELLHDRLLFLLQCLLSYMANHRRGRGCRAPPLSMGTVCRKLAALILEEGLTEQDHGVKTALQEAPSTSTVHPLKGISTRTTCTSTQTIETCLSLCAHCMELRETLAAAARLVMGALEACQQSKGQFPTAEAGRACADADRGAAEWLRMFEGSVSNIVSSHKSALDRCVSLASCLQSAEQRLAEGEDALSAAQQELASAVASSEAASQERLGELEEHYSQEVQTRESRVAQLEQTRAELEYCTAELQQKLLEAETTVSEQREEVDRLQQSLLTAQHNNASLRTAASDHSALLTTLREQLAEKAGRVLQLEECHQDQERQLAALHNRAKSLQCKHSELVVCLGEVEAEREALSLSLQQSQEECSATDKKAGEQAREVTLLCQQLSAKEEALKNNVVAMKTQHSELEECRQVCQTLMSKVAASAAAVHQEQDRCRLLMDYPSLRRNCDAAGLGSAEARQHMCANTVRIMLLEEQNSLLRSRMAVATEGERPRSVGKSFSRLWQPGLLQGGPQLHYSSEPSVQSAVQDTKGEQKYKGHLGHLVEALRCASRLSEGSPAEIRSRWNAWS